MGEIATSERQITFFFSSASRRAKKALAFARSKGLPIQKVDILKTRLTGTQIAEFAGRLGLEVRDLVNQNHPSYTSQFEPHEFSSEDWIKMIRHHPEIMKQPIAVHGDRTVLVETPKDVLKV